MQSSLTAEVASSDILATFKSMPAGKFPGPDGFTTEFFKVAQEVVGEQVVAAVQELFSAGKLLKSLMQQLQLWLTVHIQLELLTLGTILLQHYIQVYC